MHAAFLACLALGACAPVSDRTTEPVPAPAPAPMPAIARPTAPPPAVPVAAEQATATSVLRHMVVIGASASYGINLPASLADALGALVAVPHDPPLDGALGSFSVASMETRAQLVELAAEREPSALIAVDFLFWYAHGFAPAEQRLARVEAALALLDRLQCPVVISLVPDMAPAVSFQVLNAVMPGPEMLATINRRIVEWAARRPNVIVVPLVERLDDMRHGRAIVVGPWSWPAGDQLRFVQPDGTHPTEEGLLVIARLVAEGLRARFPGLPADAFVADRDAVRTGTRRLGAAHPFPRPAAHAHEASR
ncbi:MAG TPA: hypothetical protein VK824_01145 [Planctomycetota bacterium]|nr:hypothetical protein [Planctomycetota bacterium]